MLLLFEGVAVVISGVIAGSAKTFFRFLAVEFPCHDTTMAVADEADTT